MDNRNSPDLQTELPLESALDLIGLLEGAYLVHARGASMLPLIQPGDEVVVERKTGLLRPGAILIYRQDDQLISHRLLRVLSGTDEMLQTMGDNAVRPDPFFQVKLVYAG